MQQFFIADLFYHIHAGNGTTLPSEKELLGVGVQTFDTQEKQENIQSQKEQISKLLSKLEGGEPERQIVPHSPLVAMGSGLAAIPKKLVAKILANEYINFAELPPAKGKGRPMPQSLEGQIIVVQAADLLQTRKIIPDFATWVQCFSLYAATLASKFPERIQELNGIPDNHCQSKSEVSLAELGYLRSEFQAGGSRQPKSVIG